jgi:hypothetical protein
MARTIYIVLDNVATGLPKSVFDGAVAEIKSLFAFGQLAVEARAATRFPAAIDFSDAVIRLVDSGDAVAAYSTDKFSQQNKNIRKAIAQQGIKLEENSFGRFSGNPERVGVAFMHKVVIPAGQKKLRVTFTGGAVSVRAVQEEVVLKLAGDRTQAEIKKREADAVRKEQQDPKYKYKGSKLEEENKRDLAFHALLDKELNKWSAPQQEAVGKAVGRAAAHEARHQYIMEHAETELGAGEPQIFGDKNYEQFSDDDRQAITLAIRQFATLQATATTHIETFPAGEPFPY